MNTALVETGGARLEQPACQQPNRQGKQRNTSGEVGSGVVGLAARHPSGWFRYGLSFVSRTACSKVAKMLLFFFLFGDEVSRVRLLCCLI